VVRVVILADTSGIVALLDRDDRHHLAVRDSIKTARIGIPVTTLPEVDYMVTQYLGEAVARAFVHDVLQGAFSLMSIEMQDLRRTYELMSQYSDVPIGLVDASIVALAERHHVSTILTLDRQHFSLFQPIGIPYLELLP